jgi:glycosyltransferase involved in cell wall biosynthesis/peptidoglycan/xylan/chitin deacetylase (PgdA/CDA1 family)
MGANPSASNITLPTARLAAWARRSPFAQLRPIKVVCSALGLLHRMTEEWYRQAVSWWYQARGYIVVYDRHFVFDIALQPPRDPDRLTDRFHRWSLARWYPRPDLVVYLDAPPQVLFSRKPEHRPEKLAERAVQLLHSAEQEPRFARIDANQPLESVCRSATELIRSSFGAPVRGRMARRTSPGVLRVMAYHRIGDPQDRSQPSPFLISASPDAFDRTMKWLARHYAVVPMEQVLDSARTGRALPRQAVLVTFDDAYRDFAETAWPICRRYRIPATVFVPTAFASGTLREFWWDRLYRAVMHSPVLWVTESRLGPLPLTTPGERLRAFCRLRAYFKSQPHQTAMLGVDRICEELGVDSARQRSVLTWDELRFLARDGVTLGSHTRTHPLLSSISGDEIRAELRGSREDLQREVGCFVPVFAYPSGDADETSETIVREEGFELAFTTDVGHNALPLVRPLRLRRTSINRRTSPGLALLRLTRFGSAVEESRPAGNTAQRRTSSSTPTSTRAATLSEPAADAPGVNPAYIVSRFPKISETFVFNELLAIERYGVRAEIYPLLRERESVVTPEVRQLVSRARFHPPVSLAVLRANAHFARTQPRTYFDTWCEVLRGTWGSWNFFFGALGILPKSVWLASEMTRAGITHIHAHFANHPAVAAFVVNRLTGIPFSFTAHGFDIHVDRRMLEAKIKAASFVVAVSKFNKNIMVDHCGDWADRKIQVVHCGVDTEFFSAGASLKDRPKFDIVCVARLVEVKGHRFLIEACERLKQRGLDFSCHLVGDGPLRRSITRQIVSVGLEDRIILHGSLSRSEVARLMARADVVVLASSPTKDGRREGIPVSLMEAMASGLPVVATAISGVPELVESGTSGLLVPPGDVVELADALEQLARSPAVRRAMGRAGREKVIREFNQDMSARALIGLFAPSGPIETPAAVSVAS